VPLSTNNPAPNPLPPFRSTLANVICPSKQKVVYRALLGSVCCSSAEKSVKSPTLCWYVHHAETYLKAFPDKRLAHHSFQDVTGYLEQLGRLDRIADWQFAQIVDAIEILLITAGVAVVSEIDWSHWRDSARTLPPQHPTIARETSQSPFPSSSTIPSPPNQNPAPPRSNPLKAKGKPLSALDQVRAQHRSLLQQLITEIRRRHYSIRTEQSYETWVCRFILFCGDDDPSRFNPDRVVAFLEDLAVRGQVSASTQNQALNALVFLYKQVLGIELGKLDDFVRAKRPRRLPVVLEPGEVSRLLTGLEGTQQLMASLLYGTGMRLMECVRLRVQDVDFAYHQILVRACRCIDDDDLHPRAKSWWAGGEKPVR